MLGGGLLGACGGAVAASAVWVVLGRAEDPADVRRRELLVRDLPTGVDLLGACLDAGAATESALVTVSRALPGPVGEELLAIHHRLDVGVDPGLVWSSVAEHPQLAALGRAIGRAHETGAPVGRAVHLLAEELRARSRADVESRARSIEVKAAAPLGLCLLPAFVLLGIVPMVAGVFSLDAAAAVSDRDQPTSTARSTGVVVHRCRRAGRREQPGRETCACQGIQPGSCGPGEKSGEVMSNTSLAVVRDDTGATTAEYATVTGCGVGFAAVLFKFLTSDGGQELLKVIFRAIRALLPF